MRCQRVAGRMTTQSPNNVSFTTRVKYSGV